MKSLAIPALAVMAAVGAAVAADALPDDTPVEVNGVRLACTGVGDEATSDSRWQEFAVKIEFADGQAQYLSDLDVTLSEQGGRELLSAHCNSPWFLADLPPGKYEVTARFEGTTSTARFSAPKTGQARVVVRFSKAAGN